MPQAKIFFSVRFRGTASGVRRALTMIRAEITAAGADADTLGRIETVLAEVLNNVVEHALSETEKAIVQVRGEAVPDGWRFQVIDPGRPLPGKTLPGQMLPRLDTPFDELPEGGFGWAMVHMLAQDLHYGRRSGQNCLSFLVGKSPVA